MALVFDIDYLSRSSSNSSRRVHRVVDTVWDQQYVIGGSTRTGNANTPWEDTRGGVRMSVCRIWFLRMWKRPKSRLTGTLVVWYSCTNRQSSIFLHFPIVLREDPFPHFSNGRHWFEEECIACQCEIFYGTWRMKSIVHCSICSGSKWTSFPFPLFNVSIRQGLINYHVWNKVNKGREWVSSAW